jgi:ubiquinone/menaquinone biosynthesis C-methylase UbiE
MRRTLAAAAGALALAAVLAAQSNGVHPITGRPIAPVMGWQGADWLERSERLDEELPDLAIKVLKIPKGASVADVGAGSGYMTVRIADEVGPTGQVFATDVQPRMLEMLRHRVGSRRFAHVTVVQGAIDDPKLPPGALDLELLVDVYHELSQPQAMLRHLREALKPAGRLVLIEYRKEDPAIPIRFEHKMTVREAKTEVEAEGFTLSKVDESLPRQHILIFTPSAVH